MPFGAGQSISALANRITGSEMKDLGVRVEVGQIEAAIDCRIVVDYGTSIPDIAGTIRKSLNTRVKEMTGLIVKEVNIEIVDLYFEGDETPSAAADTTPRVR